MRYLFTLLVLLSCNSNKVEHTNDSNTVNIKTDTISIVYYGNFKEELNYLYLLNIYKKSSKAYFKRIDENGKVSLDSIQENSELSKQKNYLLSLDLNSFFSNRYWDSVSDGLVRRVSFFGQNRKREIRIIGEPKELNDSIFNATDKYLEVMVSKPR